MKTDFSCGTWKYIVPALFFMKYQKKKKAEYITKIRNWAFRYVWDENFKFLMF